MKVAFHTLGCKVNQYESEAMARMFRERGFEVVGEEEPADVYVVNTCTVTAMADRKSRQFIRRMKKQAPHSIIAVTGCYVQMDADEVAKIPGVDIISGTNERSSLPVYVEEALKKRDTASGEGENESSPDPEKHVLEYEELSHYEDLGRVVDAEGRTRAYIKIEDGCNRFCSYCIVPFARGAVRSRPLEDILEEARGLIDAGYREIVLTGINTALYGSDKEESGGVEQVIAALDELEGDFRIRLSSLEPTVADGEYVKRLLKYDRLCHHMHLSAQSGSDRVLESMARPYSFEDYKNIVKVLRDFDPCYGVSTDIIAGFPGEGEEDLEDSIRLIEDCGFCRTHVFRYSKRPGTRAADMKDQIPSGEKATRSQRLMEAGEKAARAFFEKNKGKVRRVLLEEYLEDRALLCGYTDNYIRVYVDCDEKQAPEMINSFRDVELLEPYEDGMRGRIDFESDLG